MKQVSKKQAQENALWDKIGKIRDSQITEKYGFLMDEWKGKRMYGEIEHHHNDRDRSNNTLENCRTVSSRSHRHITDNNVRDVPDRLGLTAKPSKPVDKVPALAGYHGLKSFSKSQQIGGKK